MILKLSLDEKKKKTTQSVSGRFFADFDIVRTAARHQNYDMKPSVVTGRMYVLTLLSNDYYYDVRNETHKL